MGEPTITLSVVPTAFVVVNLCVLWKFGVSRFVRFFCFELAAGLAIGLYSQVGKLDGEATIGNWGEIMLLTIGVMICFYLAFRRGAGQRTQGDGTP